MLTAEVRRHLYLAAAVIALLLYLAPYLIAGKDAALLVHDTLDSNFVLYKILVESGALFQSNATRVEQVFNGIPRGALPSEFDAFTLFYTLFGPLGAYIVNRVLVTVIGFVGMYLLLRQHVIPGDDRLIIQVGAALCFAMLPFWPFGGISVAGLPLVTNAFLNIRQHDLQWPNWAVLASFPFYSSLVVSGVFILAVLGTLWLADLLRRRDGTLVVFLALLLVSSLYVFTHYRLFIAFFLDQGFHSHRAEFASVHYKGLVDCLKKALSMFGEGQYHAHSLHQRLILPVVLVASPLVLYRAPPRQRRIFILALAFIAASSLWYGLLRGGALAQTMAEWYRWVPINLSRLHFLHPMLWTIVFAVALSAVLERCQRCQWLVAGCLGLQIIIVGLHHELWANRHGPSVGEFYAERQFQAIAEAIGGDQSNYRVASLGLHPAVALYNGFYTLDGYFINYPVAYKRQFREIIAGELARNSGLRRYFDDWGSRVYLFSSELKADGDYVMNRAGNRFVVEHLAFDWDAFLALGGRYLISAVQIDERSNPGIRFLASFKDTSSAWDIYLYQVVGSTCQSTGQGKPCKPEDLKRG